MVRHIVSWNFNASLTPAEKEEASKLLTQQINALKDDIPCVLVAEAHIPPVMTLSNCDVVLYSEVDQEENLVVYRDHPTHQALVKTIQQYCCDRRCTDIPAAE